MLSKKTKYAINALVFIAKNIEEQPIPVSRIAKEQNIPLKFLEAILAELKNARIVNSKKGKYGGYSLNGTPNEINMAQITRLFDGAIALLPCVTHRYYERCEECVDEETCGIRRIFFEIRNETVQKLKAATLADIIHRERKIKNK
ncbi:MAG TPA: Rrf2 family transcriptional regulator [Salinimicrobium sp.]|nr:Rrf2 family transcriptional regulator [Salinimicrobium sp.]